ncbi:MAG: T9SS type A sorting domain-containing protein [Fibrobacterota bacterium]
MKRKWKEPEYSAIVVFLWMAVLSLSVLSAERLFCGFEQAELATWPLTSADAGDGDLTYIGSSSNQPYVAWLTSESASDVTQGTRALCHEIWSNNPVSAKLVRFQAPLWQDWTWLTNADYINGGGAGAWDSTRTAYHEYFGNVEWNARRMCPLVSLMGTVDRLPDSLRDWSDFDCLYIDVKSTAARISLWVYLFGKDRPSHRRTYNVDAGNYVTLRVPIREMAWVGGLDLSNTKNLRIELCNAEGPTKIFIDNIRLATADATPSLAVVNDTTPVVPWLLTSPHQPPRNQAIPVVDVPTRVTGEIVASAPVIVASTPTGANTDRSSGNLGNAISVFDNDHISLIGEMSGYVPWATTLATNRAWIVSTDGGATWHSDGSRTQPRVFSTTHRGSLNCWGQSDLQMRGTDYVMPMGWCGSYSPGSGHMLYHEFYKVVPTNAGWQAYPMVDYTAVPQRWSAIITMDQSSGCQSGVKLASLPSGRLFMITADWNPKAILGWALMSSYSDDGGIRWQFPQGRSALYTPANSDPHNISVNSSPSYLLPYKHNQAMLFYDQSGIFYYSIHNEISWGNFSSFMSSGYKRTISNGVTYMDSTVFLCMKLNSSYTGGPGLSLVKRVGSNSAAEQVVILSPTLKYGKLTQCGERLWFTWVDTAANAIYAKKYFIRSNTWSDSIKLVQATGKIRGTIVSTVSPPAFVPLGWYEQDVSDVKIKFLRVPIDSTEKAMDTDFDGLDDAVEVQYGCVVGNPDTDGDGLWDGQEVTLLGTNPNNTDSDNDNDNDAVELYHYTDPTNAASNVSGNTAPSVDVVRTVTSRDVRLDAGNTSDAQSDFLRYFWDIRDADGNDHYVEGSRVSLTTGLLGYRLTVDDGQGHQSVVEYGTAPDSTWVPSAGKEGSRVLLPHRCELTVSPNPSNNIGMIRFSLPEKGKTALAVYDLRGRLIKQLLSEREMQAGRHVFAFRGSTYATGVYFLRLTSGKTNLTKKIIVLR